jgi:dienelactone hydrolase
VVAVLVVARTGSPSRTASVHVAPATSRARAAGSAVSKGSAVVVAPRATRPRPAATRPPATPPAAPFAVGLRVLRLVDGTRAVRLPDGTSVPRTLVTYVRYPALGPAGGGDHTDARPARAAGPFPLIVFGHGFAVTPGPYARLLRAWVRTGYVVAAPVFPLGNANAPGGPNEADLVNQPGDMSFVISSMLAASAAAAGPLRGLLDPRRIAVSGQSDGADTALAVAYDRQLRDRRVGAAVILSGEEIPGMGGFEFPPGAAPLLATQGTADTINPPSVTDAFYDVASRPKYLLALLGASHLPPYTSEQPQLGTVERVTIAFLDRYLKHEGGAVQRMAAAGNVPGVARLDAHP